MKPKRSSLGTPKSAASENATSSGIMTKSLLDDPVIIHSNEQLGSMEKLLADHVQAVKEAGGKILTRNQRKVIVEKRKDFASSIFNQIRAVSSVVQPPRVTVPEASEAAPTQASAAASAEEAETAARVQSLEKILAESVEKLKAQRESVPALVQEVLWTHLQAQSAPAGDQASMLAMLRRVSAVGKSNPAAVNPISSADALGLHATHQRLAQQAAALEQSVPKRVKVARTVNAFLQTQQAASSSGVLDVIEQMMMQGTTFDPTNPANTAQFAAATYASSAATAPTAAAPTGASSAFSKPANVSDSDMAALALKRKTSGNVPDQPAMTNGPFGGSRLARTPVKR